LFGAKIPVILDHGFVIGISKETVLNFKSIVRFVGAWSCACIFSLAWSAQPRIGMEEFRLNTELPGVQVYVRNKHLESQNRFSGDKIVLFVHGATYPSETAFDMNLPGGSWMDYVAQLGYDAYLLDVRGYGRSTRPAAMSQAPAAHPPFATTAEAIKDIGVAVDFIRQRRGVDKINLVGWSWGTTTTAGYTTQNNDKIRKLVLYAPVWLVKNPPPVGGSGAYRTVTKESARSRGIRGIPEAKVQEISPDAWFEAWWQANLEADPEGAQQNPPVIRAPNGVVKDLGEYWMSQKPTYDPAQIKVPVMLVLAEWDQDTPLYMAQELFTQIVNAPEKKHVILGEGTHAIVLEKNRLQLMREVQDFLDPQH
jgi:pimeloyl-ACP methyl ester carboxylesterase